MTNKYCRCIFFSNGSNISGFLCHVIIATTNICVCVYMGRQIALPMMGSYNFFYLFFIIFVSCFSVTFRLVGLLSNMSFIFIVVVLSSCIPVHVSRPCSCDLWCQ